MKLTSESFQYFQEPPTISPTRHYAQMSYWVRPPHTNALGILFGGILVSWIDVAGLACAQRYCRAPVVTLSIDHLQFLLPIKVGAMVLLQSDVIFAGKTSMEVEVLIDAEDTVTGEILRAAKGYVTYVALDSAGKPRAVPPLVISTDEQRKKYADAELRRAQRREWR